MDIWRAIAGGAGPMLRAIIENIANFPVMERSYPDEWLSTIIEPLTTQFGGELTVCRDGDSVRWGFSGQSAVVDLLPNGMMRATFIDREGLDGVSNRPAAAAYRTYAAYALTPASCSRMVGDMADFFSGVREPKFTFVEAYVR